MKEERFTAPKQPSHAQTTMQSFLEKLTKAAPVKKAQDAIESFFQERDNEGDVNHQSPYGCARPPTD